MKIKELIKILCDFNPDADVELIYNNETLYPIFDFGWDCGGDGPRNSKLDALAVHIWAIDEKERRKREDFFAQDISKFHEQFAHTNCEGEPLKDD